MTDGMTEFDLSQPGPIADQWTLDPQVTFLNHGSFGAWPAPPQRLLRISAQLYNAIGPYEHLARELRVQFGR